LTTIPRGTGDHRVLHPNTYGNLDDKELTLPQMLREHGNYTTAMIGKWHLGYSYTKTDHLPVGRGFDTWLGTPATHCESGGAYPPEPLFHDTTMLGRLNYDIPVKNLMINFTSFACDFIRRSVQKKKPFFLYAAYDNTHSSVYSSDRWVGSSKRGPFGDATAELDWAVGELLETIEAEHVAENTLVFFTGGKQHHLMHLWS
jgi:arylsulfatase A-like enzyme